MFIVFITCVPPSANIFINIYEQQTLQKIFRAEAHLFENR